MERLVCGQEESNKEKKNADIMVRGLALRTTGFAMLSYIGGCGVEGGQGEADYIFGECNV